MIGFNKKIAIPAAAVTVIAIAVLLTVTYKGNGGDEKMNDDSKGIQFRKDGELSFFNAAGKQISKIDIEIADNEDAREVGMMYRTANNESHGMLFVFESESPLSFWMKNTILPLDIIFVNGKREIVKIHRYAIPYSEYPPYESGSPAMYVVEVNAGYCDKHNIKEGDRIDFIRLVNK